MVTLTPEQIARYHEEGYLVLRANEHGLATPEALKSWTDEIAAWPRVRGKWMPYDETTASGEMQLMRTENFADYHEGFGELLLGPDLQGILGQLTGDVSALDRQHQWPKR
jgi:2-aminoethylphosphonate dioxygenase